MCYGNEFRFTASTRFEAKLQVGKDVLVIYQ